MNKHLVLGQFEKIQDDNTIHDIIIKEFERTGGIFRLAPSWVGRPGIIVPGRRLKLADLYYSQDVAINERWLASVTYADNGIYNKMCPPDHGLSYIIVGKNRLLLRRALEVCPELLLGSSQRKWDVLPKFFDNKGRIPNHLHPCQNHVKKGLTGKPESYHFPIELNINRNDFPITAFGVDPNLKDAQLLAYLRAYFHSDNRAIEIGTMINLIPGTGWFTPACTLHSPGSLVTYELQVASDVTCIPESRVNDQVMPPDLIDRDIPVNLKDDGEEAVFQYILKMLRCPSSGNKDDFRREYFRPPAVTRSEPEGAQSYVIYRTGRASAPQCPDLYSAKHTEVFPNATMDIREKGAFGMIALAGHGTIAVPGKQPVTVEAVSLFRHKEQIGGDELFISALAAQNLQVTNSSSETLSFYQHFASNTDPESTQLAIPDYLPFEEHHAR